MSPGSELDFEVAKLLATWRVVVRANQAWPRMAQMELTQGMQWSNAHCHRMIASPEKDPIDLCEQA